MSEHRVEDRLLELVYGEEFIKVLESISTIIYKLEYILKNDLGKLVYECRENYRLCQRLQEILEDAIKSMYKAIDDEINKIDESITARLSAALKNRAYEILGATRVSSLEERGK